MIPDILRPLLYEYKFSLDKCFENMIYGIYLYNSVALGAFDEEKSDIDFITILNKEFENKEISTIRLIHDDLSKKYKYANKMEVMYITKDKIGKLNQEIEPYLYYCDGELKEYGYYDINHVTWWTMKYYGIPINSPNVSSLNLNVQWCNIIETMNYNLNSYWKDKLSEMDRFWEDESIEFAVLTLCRILFTLENKSITSKINSIQYAVKWIPNEHKLIIEEASRIRKCYGNKSLYESKLKRENDVKSFMTKLQYQVALIPVYW